MTWLTKIPGTSALDALVDRNVWMPEGDDETLFINGGGYTSTEVINIVRAWFHFTEGHRGPEVDRHFDTTSADDVTVTTVVLRR